MAVQMFVRKLGCLEKNIPFSHFLFYQDFFKICFLLTEKFFKLIFLQWKTGRLFFWKIFSVNKKQILKKSWEKKMRFLFFFLNYPNFKNDGRFGHGVIIWGGDPNLGGGTKAPPPPQRATPRFHRKN